MSADNYIAIYKTKSGRYAGFMFFASDFLEPPAIMPKTKPLWTVDSEEEAINKCDEETFLEYGFEFVGE